MAIKKIKHYNFSSVDLLIYMWEKRRILLAVSLLAAVVSIIVSFQITPKYRSTVVMFPTTSAPISKSLLAANYQGRESIYGFGEEEQAEQLLQVLYSDPIRERIIEKYNLMEHYDIDSTSKYPRTELYYRYSSNISFRMTQYMSVMIEVMDSDPETAANIANDIAALVDTVFNKMKKERAMQALLIVKHEYDETDSIVSSLQDSLTRLSLIGINNYNSQAERYNQAYANALASGNLDGAKRILSQMGLLSKYGIIYNAQSTKMNNQIGQLADMRQRYKEAMVELQQALPYKFIVDSAFKAEKKSYPRKSIIVIVSTFGAFLLTLILLIINDSIRERYALNSEE